MRLKLLLLVLCLTLAACSGENGSNDGAGAGLSDNCSGELDANGTQVLLPDGSTKALANVKVGDLLLAGTSVPNFLPKPVKESFTARGTQFQMLFVAFGDENNPQSLIVGPDTCFILDGGSVVKARALQTGDQLLDSQGNAVPVLHIVAGTFMGKVQSIMFNTSFGQIGNFFIANGVAVAEFLFPLD